MNEQKGRRKEDRNEKTDETRSQTMQIKLRDSEVEVIRKMSERIKEKRV